MSRDFAAPRAAYVHVPFCRHRCGYCNFTLVAGRDDLVSDYLRAIELELRTLGEPAEVDTLFFGGGTPTHLPPEAFRQLLTTVVRQFPLAPGYELSVEANPLDLTDAMLATLLAGGVNRLSIGGQSFDAAKLLLLERGHTGEQLRESVERARLSIANVSLDLIFGVPHETSAVWQADLQAALALEPAHLSTYGLTFERGTAFWARLLEGELGRMDEELERAMYATAIDTLVSAGFEHYEVSNFALPGRRCRHNEVYWSGESYQAVGPGAARYVGGTRQMNHRSTTTYLKRVLAGQSSVAESETLDPEGRARERLVFGLRRLEGVDRQAFAAATGFEINALVGPRLEHMIAHGLICESAGRVCLTREGLFVSDAIWPRFLKT